MTRHEMLRKARALGSVEITRLTGFDGNVVGRWLAGGVNTELEYRLKEAWGDA